MRLAPSLRAHRARPPGTGRHRQAPAAAGPAEGGEEGGLPGEPGPLRPPAVCPTRVRDGCRPWRRLARAGFPGRPTVMSATTWRKAVPVRVRPCWSTRSGAGTARVAARGAPRRPERWPGTGPVKSGGRNTGPVRAFLGGGSCRPAVLVPWSCCPGPVVLFAGPAVLSAARRAPFGGRCRYRTDRLSRVPCRGRTREARTRRPFRWGSDRCPSGTACREGAGRARTRRRPPRGGGRGGRGWRR